MAAPIESREKRSSASRCQGRSADQVSGRTALLAPPACGNPCVGSLVSVAALAYAGVMYATAVVGGKVVRFKLSPALARAHRQNRGNAMTEAEAGAVLAP